MPEIFDRIAAELGVSTDWLEVAVERASVNYRRIRIRKRSGGSRMLLQPSVQTKMLQYWILGRVLHRLPVSRIATAFEAGTSIVKNAEAHRNSRYSVRVDLSDFFPSITLRDLESVMRRSRKDLPEWAHDGQLLKVIGKVCFDSNGKLPIGYPSSPRIANIVMHEFDEALVGLVKTPAVFGNAIVTRYADDFVFSTDKPGACKSFIAGIRELLAKTASPHLKLNEKKTRLMSQKGGSTLITGLRIKQDGEMGVHPHYRSYVRLLLKLYSSGRLQLQDHQKLRGHLAFIQHADPSLFTKWSYSYYSEIAALRSEKTPIEAAAGETPLAKAA
jgi:RNA-directed DNA polymerase